MKRYGLLLIVASLVATNVNAQGFGGAIAFDGGDILVAETGNSTFAGDLYIFNKANGKWVQKSRLTAPGGGEDGDRFGSAFAIHGPHLLVGAAGAADGRGAVYEFTKNGGNWMESGMLTLPGTQGNAAGSKITVSGNDAFVSENGAVHVFTRNATGWTHTSHLTPVDSAMTPGFGGTISASGSYAFISGGVSRGRRGGGSGVVGVFKRGNDGKWSHHSTISNENLGPRAALGSSILIDDDVVLIGASGANNGTGAVGVYKLDDAGNVWNEIAQLNPAVAGRGDGFGSSIVRNGDEYWIGAPGSAGRLGSIFAYKIDKATGSFIGGHSVSGTDLPRGASLGGEIAASGNVAVVSAPGFDNREGAAIVLEKGSNGMWSQTGVLVNEGKGYASITGETTQCSNDVAAAFPCMDVDMVSFLSVKDIGGGRGMRTNDIWGWEDPTTGREYALVGLTDATSFVDVTDAHNPVYLGELNLTEGAMPSVWRDIKVYKDHAFIVSDGAGNHGMQIFDLTQLRDVKNGPVTFEATAHYDGIASAHNIVINEDTGYAYSVGSSSGGTTCGGGLHMINIQDPVHPEFAGCFSDTKTGRRGTGYSHDAQCVIYSGPDAAYTGKEICFGSNETAISIADVTDKNNPVALSSASYPNVAYTHQGWLTEDQRFFYVNDEGDEPQGLVEGTRTLIWDVADLDDPILVGEHIAKVKSTDHNLYIKGNLMYQSNYDSGLRILDISNPSDPMEVGFFDTVPYGEDGTVGGGSWSNYPYFKSGNIITTSGREGLFILKKKGVDS